MSMTSIEDIEKWYEGTQLYDGKDIEAALKKFLEVPTQNSRILFNLGCCYLTINDIENAYENYKSAVENDPHLAVGYFMLGLTSLLQKEYESSMASFTKSLELLRGNRMVDYKQLGLKYQLYSCEILSNQAVVRCKQNQFDEAKDLLLQAVGCKAEKRHASIYDMLMALQAGCLEQAPFVLPKNRIFRPPKSYVQGLKKKDYLGKAKVITTDNEEDIYACFSGIKDQVMQAAKVKDMNNNEKKDGDNKDSNSTENKTENEFRPRIMARSIMLKELQKPDRKKTLKKTIVKKRKPTIALGKVIVTVEKSPVMNHKPHIPRPKTSCPPRKSSSASSGTGSLSKSRSNSIEASVFIDSRSNSTDSQSSLLNSLSPSRSSSSESEESPYESIKDENVKNKRKIDIMLKQSHRNTEPNIHLDRVNKAHTAPKRFSTGDISLTEQQKRLSLSLQKPTKKPLPSLGGEDDIFSNAKNHKRYSTTDIPTEKERRLQKPTKPQPVLHEAEDEDEISNIFLNNVKNSSQGIANKKKVKKEKKIEVEVQYTFIKKLKVPVGCDMDRLHEIIKSVRVPDQVELCVQDQLGRQRTLSADNLDDALFQTSKPQKILCFPEI